MGDGDVDKLYQSSFGWPDHYRARSVQAAMVEAAKTVTEPTLIILEAETGVGKTEAALAAAHVIANATDAQGFYFAAPTMATANGLLERTIGWTKNTTEAEAVASLYLAHSKNQLSQPYQQLRFKGIGEDYPTGDNVVASSWMTNDSVSAASDPMWITGPPISRREPSSCGAKDASIMAPTVPASL